ncbi:tetratricopeptide repeat protein [Pontiella agarivorans]|uniref:Tetratricopeptide repeat protein n=1 Tax=Pontiella agarivorans TaxID=3038953 RepID=A0ABU5N1C7_9BACT|nr:tetratricopeptide repeat protein [Pontiella agarivorans]MDZ8120214.1 tetratricopeptide repeat protein [Pontiella agarivorans]
MLTKKAGRFSVIRQLVLAIVLLGSATCAFSAEDAPTAGEMLKSAMKAMQAKQYDDAIDWMYQYIGEVEASKAPRVVAIAQDTRFKLASILIQKDRYDEAAAVLQDYIDTPLADKPRQAMKMLATCYFDTEAYEECATTVTNALYYNENPVLIATRTSDDDDDEEDYSKQKIEPEDPYTQDELTTMHMTLAESYFNIEKYEECIPAYSYVIEHTDDDQRKGFAMMQVINALIEIPAFDRILEWVPQLYRTEARYDIRVNLALMNAAAALYDAAEYDSALPLYRMIMPRDELVKYQEGKLRDLRLAYDMAPEEGAELTEAEKLLFGGGEEEKPADGETAAVEEKEVPKPIRELEALIDALKALPPYELNIQYRMADLYKTVERYWEALKFFETVYRADPTTEVGERCVYELVDMLLENLDELERAEELAHEHMGKYTEGMTPRQLAYMLTGYYQSHDMMPRIKTLKPYIDTFVRTNEETIVKYDTELYFMQAVSDLVGQNYEESEKGFKYVLDEFPKSHQEANCIYWYAMSQLFLQKYADALTNFDRYISMFPSEQYVDECYFQGGVCFFGQEMYDKAKERFTHVIETYPDSSVYPEACSMRGDLHGASDEVNGLDLAIEDYERAYVASKKVNQATYATFQAAEVYEAEEKYDDILRVVERYEQDWNEEADIAKARFWIGKTKIQQKKYDEAVDTYVGAIVKYGGDLRQDGVDQMINELVKISRIYLDIEAQDKLIAELDEARDAAENETLLLRLRVTLAKLLETEMELGSELLAELESFDNASPPVLALICDASFENKDYDRAEEILRIFINKFEDSDFMRAAYKLRAFGQYDEKDYEGTLATINDAQALYGTDYDVAWAQLLKAQVLLDEGEIEEAREANMSIRTVPSWRGVPVAQATFQLGEVEELAGNLPKAFGWYQRTYFQYKGHAGGYWAAEGYLASARILKKMGRENDVRNTYRALLFDPYVNTLPQADVAREYLGATEVAEIVAYMDAGNTTNITIAVEAEMSEGGDDEHKAFSSDAAAASSTEESE